MKRRMVRTWILVLLLSCPAWAQSSKAEAKPDAANSTPSPKPMEAVFKNIQVLKGVPSAQLGPIMHFMRSSLGVRCEYCHVAEEGKYQLDAKPAKQRAREMLLMTEELNRSSFGGANVVTCNTCHRGSVHPVAVPEAGSSFENVIRREPDEPEAPLLPTFPKLLADYEAATHVNTLPATRLTLEASHAKIVDAGTPRARAIARAATNQGEVVINGDRARARSPLPDGRFVLVGSNGERAWTMGPDGLRWIPASAFLQFQRKLNPLRPLQVRASEFVASQVSGPEMIDGQEAYLVTATGADGGLQKLWFAKQSRLLLRRTFYHAFALGLDPEQFDFSDYRNYQGFRLPWQINTSYLDDQHLGVLKRIVKLQFNVPISDSEFLPPR